MRCRTKRLWDTVAEFKNQKQCSTSGLNEAFFMFARPVILLLSVWIWSARLWAVELDDSALRSELLQLASPDAQVRKSIITSFMDRRDGRLAAVLEAYRLGGLRLWNDQLVKIRKAQGDDNGFLLLDALSGEPLVGGTVTATKNDLKKLVVTRADRQLLVNSIRVLQLYAPEKAIRLAAVRKLGDLRNAKFLSALREIAETETDAQVAYRAEEGTALIRLATAKENVEQLREAATQLGEMASARGGPLLEDLLSKNDSPDLDEQSRDECQMALEKINQYQGRIRLLGYAFNGLSLGSILILIALGLSIVFGQMGVINMAHGELIMVGAYTTYVTQLLFGHSMPDNPVNIFFVIALPVSFFTAALVGWLMEYLIVRHLYGRPLETLLATWGVGLMLIQTARIIFGDNIGVNSPTWLVGGFEVIQDFQVPYNRLFTIVLTTCCVLFVYWLMNRTKRGLLLRATVQNREMAAALGVNTRLEDGFTFALGAGLAGIAGCALTLIGGVTPDMGQNYIVDAFLVVVTGGVGEIAGAVWAGLGIGMLNKILEPIFSTIWGKILILAMVIAFIQWRPAGLFPPKGRLADV